MEAQSGDPDATSGPVDLPNGKRRWRRNRVACDSCHTRRVRCDRAFPCSRCLRSDIHCEFTRERRKRGRIARAKLANASTAPGEATGSYEPREDSVDDQKLPGQSALSPMQDSSPESGFQQRSPTTNELSLSARSIDGPQSATDGRRPARPGPDANATEEWLSAAHLSPESYDILGGAKGNEGPLPRLWDIWTPGDLVGHHPPKRPPHNPPVPAQTHAGSGQKTGPRSGLKYPVLEPVMPFIESNLPRRLVCDLLELYFTSAISTHMHPVCHHIHCYVLRKASFLSTDRPRPSSPALLASMLWVAAVDDRAFSLSISPLQRRKICQFLCALTIRLVRPLIHVSFKDQEPPENANASQDLATAAAHHPFEGVGDDKGLVGPAGSLDDVVTYIHVASIISSSEQKAASMRWWHAAFTLARELKLNQEIEVMPNIDGQSDGSSPSFGYSLAGWASSPGGPVFDYSNPSRPSLNCVCDEKHDPHSSSMVTEEHREERRRTWWLLYIMDRHLALCYNRPLALLDAESEDLLLPLDEGSWQAGNIHSNSPRADGPQCPRSGDRNKRRVFPNFICHDHSILGFFLPLMTITGELIDLNQARNHPTLGLRLQGKEAWEVHVVEVLRQLEIYKASLTTFAAAADPDGTMATGYTPKPDTPDGPMSQAYSWHTQTVIAYASYLVHVLHILLVGKWDPVSLIEDKDFWTSSPAFASTISHALEAADAVQQILRYDPDISFMPYFFGIQLLQGSFLLLLIVERLQKEAGEGILNACETMIRATESCVVTLNTEYQRSFRQVMRSAVAQARGRPVNPSEIRHRRKAVLALYRWTRKGTGLAL
ncbi:Arabinanolytic transcriptional activator araR [Penicillium macrosclerotiorum]|uniref:Arabinanolytic transcriptional activator araR n=1 Tax=Penicillium macrosclerotiorum TaxID=303699 RepID=UPI002547E055|nr:Arabinanolytic transcriptional activator araR [Penicillium macrosclerotiorum]KAJ5675428.1 Arabinanolytic transcriptional activator araR [Penicillium macrosclerotiorum]